MGTLKQLITNMEDQPTGNYEAFFVFAKGIKKKEEFSIEKLLIMSMRFLEELMWRWQQRTFMKNSVETRITVEELQGFILD